MAKKVVIEFEAKGAKEVTQEVGKLTDSVDDLGGNVGGAFGQLSKGFSSLKKGLGAAQLGFKGLKGAIAATGLGLLVIALGAVVTYFTKTQKGMELVERGMAAITTTISVIIDRFASLGEALLSLDLGGMIDSFSGVTDEIVKEVIAVDALTVSMQGLAYEQSQFIVDSARLTAEFEKQKKISDNVNLSFEERTEATNKAAEAQRILLEESQRLLKEETIALLQGGEGAKTRAEAEQLYNDVLRDGKELKLENLGYSASTLEDLNAANALIADAIKLEGEFAAKTTETQNKLNSLAKEEKAVEEARQAARLLKKEQDTKDREDKLIQEQLDSEKKIADREKELAEQAKQDAEDEARRQKIREGRFKGLQEIETVEVYYEGLKVERTKAEIQNDARLADAKVQSAAAAAGSLISIGNSINELAGKNAKFAKGLAVAQIAIDTATGVSGAIAAGAGIPFPGNVPAILSGVAAVVGGMVSAKNALKQANGAGASSFNVTDTSTKTSASGGKTSFSSGPSKRPVVPNDSAVFASQQLFGAETETVGSGAGSNQRVYVVESDITNIQGKVETIESNATFG